MRNINKKQTQKSPPNLLKGILISVFGITICILSLAWFAIDYQIEQLVVKRTSEYAHSIARIAADSSAEALLADDKLQLNLLVQNVAKDPYIRQAAIISENGQTVTQYPEDIESSAQTKIQSEVSDFSPEDESELTAKKILDKQLDEQQSTQKTSLEFVTRRKNKVFFEPLVYQNITAGWFKLEIDKYKLEQNFREAFVDVQLMIGGIGLLLFILLLLIVFRLDKNIRQLASHCQHLLFQNNIRPPSKKTHWLNAIKELSETHLQQLQEHIHLPKKTDQWINARIVESALVCYLEFDIPSLDNPEIAQNLTQAEDCINKSTQAFGVQTQGDILTGCLIPISELSNDKTKNKKNALTEAVSLIYLIKQLLSLLTPNMPVKAFMTQAPVLYLENEQEITTGISLADKSLDKIKQLSLITDYDDVISLSIPQTELEAIAQVSALDTDDKNRFKLLNANTEIEQLIARKFQYLSKN